MKETAVSRGPSQRVLSIDILRGGALIGMVMVHFMIFFGNDGAVDSWPYFLLNHILGDWGAACFLMMMGMSQVLSWQKHAELDEMLLFKRALIRGTYIFLVGLLMLALAWGPYQIWQWDILTLMGVCTVLVFLCRKLPSWLILLLVAAMAICMPWLRGGLNFDAVWGGDFMQVPVISRYFPGILIDPVKDYEVIWNFKDIVQGFFLAGYFPVVPWSLFPLLGVVLGRRVVSGKMRRDLPWLVMAGIGLAGLGLGLAYAGTYRPESSIINGFVTPLSFYPDSFTMILFQTGMALTIFGLLFYFFDVRRRTRHEAGRVMTILNRTSGFSLYLLLHALHAHRLDPGGGLVHHRQVLHHRPDGLHPRPALRYRGGDAAGGHPLLLGEAARQVQPGVVPGHDHHRPDRQQRGEGPRRGPGERLSLKARWPLRDGTGRRFATYHPLGR